MSLVIMSAVVSTTYGMHASHFTRHPRHRSQASPHRPCMGVWVDLGSCTTKVNVPAETAFEMISDYQRWPLWSPWLSRVETFEPDPSGATSRWFLKFKAINVNWGSRVVDLVPGTRLRWESTSGVRNSGSVHVMSLEHPSSCRLTIALRYEIPALVAKVFSAAFVSNLVSRRLAADLSRFRTYCEQEYDDAQRRQV